MNKPETHTLHCDHLEDHEREDASTITLDFGEDDRPPRLRVVLKVCQGCRAASMDALPGGLYQACDAVFERSPKMEHAFSTAVLSTRGEVSS